MITQQILCPNDLGNLSVYQYDLYDWGINRLSQLVGISSSTNDISGVNSIQNEIANDLLDLGFKISFEKNPVFKSGDLLVARYYNNIFSPHITIMGHADCVLPLTEKTRFKIKGDKAFGAGVADDKSGLICALIGLKIFFANQINPNLNISFISSPNEEQGSKGFSNIFKSLGHGTDYNFGFEPALDENQIISSRNGNIWYDITVKGESVHSGRKGRNALNAAHEFARKLVEIEKFVLNFDHASLNVSRIEGGFDVFNITCGELKVKLDLRFSCENSRAKLLQIIHQKLTHSKRYHSDRDQSFEISYSIEDDCPSMSLKPKNIRFANQYVDVLNTFTPYKLRTHEHSNGAADINYLSNEYNLSLDGLGCEGNFLHQEKEFIYTDSLYRKGMAFAKILNKISTQRMKI
ncbi:MAG: M20/M25/M40 family metallo-hydrolase [Halobacteriovoraceae bacterium]|nr:M20/M25/M40 family metallo-hydrolase [Halobacteriovoraceae bacterium]